MVRWRERPRWFVAELWNRSVDIGLMEKNESVQYSYIVVKGEMVSVSTQIGTYLQRWTLCQVPNVIATG